MLEAKTVLAWDGRRTQSASRKRELIYIYIMEKQGSSLGIYWSTSQRATLMLKYRTRKGWRSIKYCFFFVWFFLHFLFPHLQLQTVALKRTSGHKPCRQNGLRSITDMLIFFLLCHPSKNMDNVLRCEKERIALASLTCTPGDKREIFTECHFVSCQRC